MLSVEKIHKTFHAGTIDEKVLFSDFSLEIGDREFVTVIGSNGSGKTTLLNLIAGDLKPDSGRIVLDGRELTGMGRGISAGYFRIRPWVPVPP